VRLPRRFSATLGHGEYGLLITISGFATTARDFAKTKNSIRLIDGPALVELLLEHYEDLQPKCKAMIPLKRVYRHLPRKGFVHRYRRADGCKRLSNTHEVIGTLFRAMNTTFADRASAGLPRWTSTFPYVNGGLFSGGVDVPRFSRIARSYLLRIGNLDWIEINRDIFGSMIQAVAEGEERGALGMHYTSVPIS
jgi:hypothetical protein